MEKAVSKVLSFIAWNIKQKSENEKLELWLQVGLC